MEGHTISVGITTALTGPRPVGWISENAGFAAPRSTLCYAAFEGCDMTLWILRPIHTEGDDPWEPWYDKCFGFVVRTETEEQARQIADFEAGDENHGRSAGKHPWLHAKYSTCEPLEASGEPGLVMRDFHAA